ncbi:hypothetical protein ABTE20_20900, partial [Acinetobacter baumannii]
AVARRAVQQPQHRREAGADAPGDQAGGGSDQRRGSGLGRVHPAAATGQHRRPATAGSHDQQGAGTHRRRREGDGAVGVDSSETE